MGWARPRLSVLFSRPSIPSLIRCSFPVGGRWLRWADRWCRELSVPGQYTYPYHSRYRRATSAGAVRLGGLRCSQCDGWSVTADPVQLAADVAVACSVPLPTSGHADFGGSPTRRIRWIRRMLGIVGTRKRPSQTSGCREARRCRVVFRGALRTALLGTSTSYRYVCWWWVWVSMQVWNTYVSVEPGGLA